MSFDKSGQGRATRRAKSDSRRVAADGVYAALVATLRDGGDAALAEALEQLTVDTGKNHYRHMAKIARREKFGRKAIDDRLALERIRKWPATDRHNAVGKVARDLAGPRAADEELTEFERRAEAHAQRLRRKLRKINERISSVRQSAAI